MRPINFLGLLVLLIVLFGIFLSLFYFYNSVGQAISYAEIRDDIRACDSDSMCEGICMNGYCRDSNYTADRFFNYDSS